MQFFFEKAAIKLRRNVGKRLARVKETQTLKKRILTNASKLLASPPRPFAVTRAWEAEYQRQFRLDSNFRAMLSERMAFLESRAFQIHVADARALAPEIGMWNNREDRLLAPWHDNEYLGIRDAVSLLPQTTFDTVLMVPFGKLGGADLVAGVLARTVSQFGSALILRTDGSDWDRPDWYPKEVMSIDISGALANSTKRSSTLYALMEILEPKRIYNVNSRACFEMFAHYGSQLATRSELYAYYFCADRSDQGVEVGYPVWYFANIFPYLTAALIDTKTLADTLSKRFLLPDNLKQKIRVVYTPALTALQLPPAAALQIASKPSRERPRFLWAGRLDKQKRFDLLLEIAKLMPDADFECWGKAVLDAPPNTKNLPRNVTLHPPFTNYEELPLANSDGWIYTAAWDGLPTILIECAALGMPIVASAVGGVPELIDEETGWPVNSPNDPNAYVTALRDMLNDDGRRLRKVAALQNRIRTCHSQQSYADQLIHAN